MATKVRFRKWAGFNERAHNGNIYNRGRNFITIQAKTELNQKITDKTTLIKMDYIPRKIKFGKIKSMLRNKKKIKNENRKNQKNAKKKNLLSYSFLKRHFDLEGEHRIRW